ncbi:cytotoxic and regulatory T-cell molecule isoform 2-T2 [Pholidichthys leucotaenia]
MEVKLQLSVFVQLIHVSLALWQRVTVLKGQTLSLRCPISNAHKTHVDWKNPEGYIMFFNRNQALKDERYAINRLSRSEFSISISNVTFKDGGNYTCTHYGEYTTEKTVEVTVLGYPIMSAAKYEGKTIVKCTAEGNHFAPHISWKIGQEPEFHGGHAYIEQRDKSYVSVAMIDLLPQQRKVTVMCLVRHPALQSQPLLNFIKAGRKSKNQRITTMAPSHITRMSTQMPQASTSWTARDTSAVSSTSGPPTYSTMDVTSASSDSTTMSNDTFSNTTSTAGWTPSGDVTFNNSSERNGTENFGSKKQTGSEGNSSLLVILITCLICGLLVVVIFFAIKLRRAHIAWKKENEDSDPSEESSKSKSSQEDKNSQGQRRRGLFNTTFAQYVIEEPTLTVNAAAMPPTESTNKKQNSDSQSVTQTSTKCNVKETSL